MIDGSQASILAIGVMGVWAGSAAVMDWRSRRLPNTLTLGGALVALAWLAATSQSPSGAPWRECLLAGAGAALLTVPAYAKKAMGAGDVKLATAMGLLGGLKVIVGTILVGSVVSGVLALALLLSGKAKLRSRQRTVPFGTALGAGFVFALFAVQLNWY